MYLERGAKFADDKNFSIKIPYLTNLTTLGIYETKTDKPLVRVDTTKVMADFCSAHQNDPDCKSAEILPFIVAGAGILAVIGIIGGLYMMRKRRSQSKN